MLDKLSEMQSYLFQDAPTSEILGRGSPIAPSRTVLSQYVINELPRDIKEWNDDILSIEELAKRQVVVLEAEQKRLRTLKNNEEAAVAHLDMLMLLGAYLPTKEVAYQVAPPLLLELLTYLSARHHLPYRLTYELIVDVNVTAFLRSGGDIRTFSNGKTGRVERDFYVGHYLAEQHIRRSYELLRTILDHPAMTDKHTKLKSTLKALEQFTSYMTAFERLPPDSYAYFRRFLVPYPDNVRNASGAFMPTPQLFEMLLHTPGFTQTEYLRHNLQYFSRWAQEDLQAHIEAKAQPVTLQSLLDSGTLPLETDERKLVDAIIEQFVQFKLTHIKVASSKIPEAFPKPPILGRENLRAFQPQLDAKRNGTGTQQGTGGFTPQDFLADGVGRLLNLQIQLRQ
ncbi:MAG TPA: hypothetical protein VLG36_05635 [Candidatus Chromulinivoraceae bacterium]|nr:hypothetical protein [Candidatus Chromulinivoraceae bacterium]